jgi:hypothetical protein
VRSPLSSICAELAQSRRGKGLGIAEALAAQDPANARWQVDLAYSCSKLGELDELQTIDERRKHLQRGHEILARLKEQGRLHPQQDSIQWFDIQLASLSPAAKRKAGTR